MSDIKTEIVENINNAGAASNPRPLDMQWDQLEETSKSASEAKQDEPDEGGELPDEEIEEVEGEEAEEGDEGDGERDASDDEESEEEVEEESEETVEPTEPVRFYNVRDEAGNLVKVSDQSEIKIKANGRFQRFKVADLVKNMAGEVAWNEKIGNVKQLEKQYKDGLNQQKQHNQLLDQYVTDLVAAAEEGDVYGSFEMIAEMLGKDQEQFVGTFLTAFENFYHKMAEMEPADRRAFFLERKNKSMEKRISKKEQTAKQKQNADQIAGQIAQYQQKYDILDSELQDAFTALKEDRGGDVSSVTVDQLIGLVLDSRTYSHLLTAIEETGAELDDSSKVYAFNLARAAEKRAGSSLELDDYCRIVKSAADEVGVDSKAVANIRRKVRKRPTKKTGVNSKPPSNDGSRAKNINSLWESL